MFFPKSDKYLTINWVNNVGGHKVLICQRTVCWPQDFLGVAVLYIIVLFSYTPVDLSGSSSSSQVAYFGSSFKENSVYHFPWFTLCKYA